MRRYSFIYVIENEDRAFRVGVNYTVHSHGDPGCITGPADNWVEPSGPELDIDDCDVLGAGGEVLEIELTEHEERMIEDDALEHYTRSLRCDIR